ncbi:MAG: aspartate aminotransferase family protein [Candidatus Bathyarchaeia archaeon]
MTSQESLDQVDSEYLRKHPQSRALYEKAAKHFARGVTHDSRYFEPTPIYCIKAKGSHKWDVDGNEYMDFWMGHGALILGHAHPAVTKAVVEQVRKGTHYGASHEIEIEWAEKVKHLIPCARNGLVEFTSSGTEATMMAFRIARAYTGKSKIVKFISHFHGWLDYSIVDFNPAFSPPLTGSFPSGVPSETCKTVVALPPNDLESVEKTLSQGDVAAVILEPGGAQMGCLPTSKSFLEELRKITKQNDVVLIFDEVVTGFRDSPGGAQEHYGVVPDLSTLGKILGGGFPGGAVTGKREIMEMLDIKTEKGWSSRRISHPGTFNANPLCAAAGKTCLGLIAEGKVHPKINCLGEELKSALNGAMLDNGVDGLAWGTTPSIIYVGFGVNEEDLKVTDIDSYVAFQRKREKSQKATKMLEKSLINKGVHPMGSRFILSIAHSKKDLLLTVEKFDSSLKELKSIGFLKEFI